MVEGIQVLYLYSTIDMQIATENQFRAEAERIGIGRIIFIGGGRKLP